MRNGFHKIKRMDRRTHLGCGHCALHLSSMCAHDRSKSFDDAVHFRQAPVVGKGLCKPKRKVQERWVLYVTRERERIRVLLNTRVTLTEHIHSYIAGWTFLQHWRDATWNNKSIYQQTRPHKDGGGGGTGWRVGTTKRDSIWPHCYAARQKLG